MPVLGTHAAAIGRKNKRYCNAGLIVAAFVALLAGACSAVPPPRAAMAADPDVAVPAARYSSVTAPYGRQRPVEPLPWRERNDAVAPQARP